MVLGMPSGICLFKELNFSKNSGIQENNKVCPGIGLSMSNLEPFPLLKTFKLLSP